MSHAGTWPAMLYGYGVKWNLFVATDTLLLLFEKKNGHVHISIKWQNFPHRRGLRDGLKMWAVFLELVGLHLESVKLQLWSCMKRKKILLWTETLGLHINTPVYFSPLNSMQTPFSCVLVHLMFTCTQNISHLHIQEITLYIMINNTLDE